MPMKLQLFNSQQSCQDNFFNKWCWENWILSCGRLKIDLCLSPCTKINSRWIKDLKSRPEILKVLGENTSRCRHRQELSE
jgi:hypothetical protein